MNKKWQQKNRSWCLKILDHVKLPDLWTTFNTVQENLIRGGLRGRTAKGNRTSTRAVKGVSENVRLNKALWTLAEKMAQLKH